MFKTKFQLIFMSFIYMNSSWANGPLYLSSTSDTEFFKLLKKPRIAAGYYPTTNNSECYRFGGGPWGSRPLSSKAGFVFKQESNLTFQQAVYKSGCRLELDSIQVQGRTKIDGKKIRFSHEIPIAKGGYRPVSEMTITCQVQYRYVAEYFELVRALHCQNPRNEGLEPNGRSSVRFELVEPEFENI